MILDRTVRRSAPAIVALASTVALSLAAPAPSFAQDTSPVRSVGEHPVGGLTPDHIAGFSSGLHRLRAAINLTPDGDSRRPFHCARARPAPRHPARRPRRDRRPLLHTRRSLRLREPRAHGRGGRASIDRRRVCHDRHRRARPGASRRLLDALAALDADPPSSDSPARRSPGLRRPGSRRHLPARRGMAAVRCVSAAFSDLRPAAAPRK